MLHRRLTVFAFLTLVAFVTILLVAFYLLPTMSSNRVILAVDFEVRRRGSTICWTSRYLGECKYLQVFAGIWASARGVLPKVYTSTGHLPGPQRLGEKYKVGSSQLWASERILNTLLDMTLIAFVQGADCGWTTRGGGEEGWADAGMHSQSFHSIFQNLVLALLHSLVQICSSISIL